jgi:hypothetical protein
MLPDQPADVPVSPELAEVRDVVRRLEARTAGEHGVDTPAYWRAMSDRLQEHLAGNRFAPVPGLRQDRAAERAYSWLVRVASAYRALAEPGVRS